MLTDQQKTYFDEIEKTFNTQGWKLFIDDLKGNLEAIKNSLLAQADVEKFFMAKGRFLVLNDILSFQESMQYTRKALEQQDEVDSDAAV
jgi:hypothetical protein